jgi:FlaA1/EpsC-like NDP-sugar epimerase
MNLAIKFNVNNFCLISSDKAVRPTNIMGASKRLAELSLVYLNNLNNHSTNFCAVRFGNVINSSGSVKPIFQSQIDSNQPLTLTHKKIIRYFMTIEEAANLVLNTIKISKGGEIFLLDMGDPIKLYDLAKLMIQFSGKTIKKNGSGDIEIKTIGLREGEKLYEELLIDKESVKSSIKSIYQSLEKQINNKQFKRLYSQINHSYKSNNTEELKKILRNNFINYMPQNEK